MRRVRIPKVIFEAVLRASEGEHLSLAEFCYEVTREYLRYLRRK